MTIDAGATRPKILVVDDVELVGQLTAIALGDQFDVETATDGHAALSALGRADFDLVLMDLEMPGLSGYDATTTYRQGSHARETLIVALSAASDAESVRRAEASGMNAHIARPIGPLDLKRQINLLLEKRARPATPSQVWQKGHYDEIANRIGRTRSEAVLSGLLSSFAEAETMLLGEPIEDTALQRKTHDLASVAGMLGFEEVFFLCRSLQDKGSANAPDVPRLSLALARASLVIQAELSEKH